MKMKQRLLRMTIMLFLCGNVSSQLTPDENVERGQQCGKQLNAMTKKLYGIIEIENDDWIVRLTSPTHKKPILGAFISSNYILVSAEIVGSQGKCTNGTNHSTVPPNVLNSINITLGTRNLTSESAIILNSCNGALMLIKTQGKSPSFACIFQENPNLKADDDVQLLGIEEEEKTKWMGSKIKSSDTVNLQLSGLEVKKFQTMILLVNDLENGTSSIVSVVESPSSHSSRKYSHLSTFSTQICPVTGICRVEETEPTSTTPTSSTSTSIPSTTITEGTSDGSTSTPTTTEESTLSTESDPSTTTEEDGDEYTPEVDEEPVSYGPVKHLVDLEVEDYDSEQDRIEELNKIIDGFDDDELFNGSQRFFMYFSLAAFLLITIIFV